MADNNFRAYRSRDGVGRDDIDAHVPDAVRDPLAELARLIGQADPDAEYDRVAQHEPAPQYQDAATVAPGQDWAADDGYDDQRKDSEQGYDYPTEPHPALRDYPSYQDSQQPQYDDRHAEPADHYNQSGRYEAQSGRHDVDDERYADDELPPLPHGRNLPALAPQQFYDDEYQDEGQWDEDGRPYAAENYEEDAESRPRRSGLALVLGVVGLVTIGAASAFAYRAMFGGALIPSLPPIIKASGGPNKIVPAAAASMNRADAGSQNSGEKLVPREEQPVPIEPENAPPRIVATIPVLPQSSGLPSPGPATQAAFPPPPGAAPAAAPIPTSQSTEPKKVHTVLIKPEQHGSAASSARANAPEPIAPHTALRAVAPSSPNAPLALVPTAQGNAQHEHVAPRNQIARAEPGPGAPISTSPGAVSSGASARGGYSVQVTSQRSEAEAQTAYRELQAKYPGQLGGHHATIHQADLGAKGTYYRAMIGPYPSAEAAAGMCSSLKAAGGNCIVQRN